MVRPKSVLPGLMTFLPKKKFDTVDLQYDIDNIRLSHQTFTSVDEIEEALWKMPDMEFLYEDISQRGLEEPPIVDGNTVLEGNRRLAVCKRLNKEQKTGKKFIQDFSKIICIPIDPNTSQLDKEAFLASIHIAGKHEWPDFNQARLLKTLHDQRHVTYDTLAAITRKSKPTIIKKIEAYNLVEEYHIIYSNDDTYPEKYPHMWEFLRSDLDDVRDDTEKKKLVMDWLHENKIPNSRDVRHLNSIFKNSKALRALKEKTIKEALYEIIKDDPTIKSPTYKKLVKIKDIVDTFPTKEFADTLNDDAKFSILKDLRTSLDRLIKQIDSVRRKG
ncbi:Hypothetical protein Nlim_1296 [Candidatus Nitrosarchaeum limnium SFB1]|jgi:hypothetical protein|uniref:ParB/Sulfiredoxin domain-containing protein n=1 Tax=Candidatus Nitrosarchaeum limnium SFB1 TaxID=886738 RepID=F3KLB7_9ARCH|nr:Hypothetical protein Nlim_1296 [Candidatus Nitrosarchaeum limnium SFB1]